ncbi:MBL fold metallo-hydrolase [Halorientalis sp. IM1011]|uniref:MBL fold metallo-hydrolase n=1 Tax=Halorientalis sp. IM1011 TaxID=1932360 RepID=UPI00097CC3A4|nr:MBL fold metallo-hydrolase [Halorientalis sp. IM1011]AQL44337.1 MBL fold metallo-hydrolase [Halorientalis sp. IM1011]
MDADDFPTPDVAVDEIEPSELKERIDAGESVTILDARMESDFEEWHVDGDSVEIANVPYFHFLDEDVDADLLERVPEGDPLVVLCAKGGASEYVAGRLAEAGRDVVHLEEGMNGWARIYEREEVSRYDGPGDLYQYQRPSSGCLGYLLVSDDEAAVVDPLRAFTDRYLDDAAELDAELSYAFDTHIHADHISGVRALDDRGVTGVIPEAARQRDVAYIDDLETAEDGDVYEVGEASVETIHTPGHTSGMTSYLLGESLLATGDGLFIESVARPDLEEGDEGAPDAARQLYETLQTKVLTLDDDVLVGGAHFSDAAVPADDGTYTAPIGQLEAEMDALTMDEQEFVDLVLSDMPPRPANYEDIIATNLGQQTADDEEAFELELGPNNCAASQDALTGD